MKGFNEDMLLQNLKDEYDKSEEEPEEYEEEDGEPETDDYGHLTKLY